MVWVQSLHLLNFRNYDELTVQFSPKKNLFLGDNGQGKTNLLESLYLLSHARSHRTAQERDLLHWGETAASVSSTLASHDYAGQTQLGVRIKLQGERLGTRFRRDAHFLRSRSEVLGILPTVSFFLPDLLLLRGGPDDRRRWLDAAIVQYDKRHLDYMSDFQRIRQQKNHLLKQEGESVSREHLAVWNNRFAEAGAQVTASRLAYLSMIETLVGLSYMDLSNHQEQLAVAYQSQWLDLLPPTLMPIPPSPTLPPLGGGRLQSFPINNGNDIISSVPVLTDLESCLAERLENGMSDEIRRGTSLIGPHRDDIRFTLDNRAAETYGSQGQQRSIVLALKLTELKCLSAKLREPPLLLLDDVMAELDPHRQRLLLEHFHEKSQVLMTTTHATASWQALLADHSDDMAVFQVEKGQLVANEHKTHFTNPTGSL